MKSNVKVHEVNETPAIGNPEMQQGIRTREAAETWAIKNGYTVVYLFKKHERVYADRLTRNYVELIKKSVAGLPTLESKS